MMVSTRTPQVPISQKKKVEEVEEEEERKEEQGTYNSFTNVKYAYT